MPPSPAPTATPSTQRRRSYASREVVGFLIVGVAATALDFAAFNALLAAGLSAGWSNVLAMLLSMTAAFVGNYRWSFSHRTVRSLPHAYTTFALINLVSLGFVQLSVVMADRLFDGAVGPLNVAKAGALVVATAARFVGYRALVFRADS